MEPLTAYSYLYLATGVISFLVLSVFIILLFQHFFKKRTIGTFMLILAYGNLLLNEIFATTSFIYEGLFPTDETAILTSKILQLIGVFLLVYTINWIYFFGNRHLIRDNDLFKSVYTSVFGTVTGVSLGLSLYDAISGVSNPIWYSQIQLEEVNFHLYYPGLNWPYILIIGGLFLIGSYTYIRLAIRTFQLQRKAKDVVTKKGFRIITWSILLLLTTGLFLGVYIFGAGDIAIVSALFYIARGLIVLSAVFTGYIGWIMPDWARKRFRGKAWITKVYTGKIPEPAKSVANEPIETSSSVNAVEVSEI